jgi:hypothetical protein
MLEKLETSVTTNHEKFKHYMKFRNDYLYLIRNKGKIESLEVFIPNDIFKLINHLPIPAKQKAFAFCLYCLVKVSNWKGHPLPIPAVKELWGYAPKNKSLNELVKANGILDSAGITKTEVRGIKSPEGQTKVQYKDIAIDIDKTKGFFKVNTEIILLSMFENDLLGTIGFCIYSFLCKTIQMQGKGTNKTKIAYDYIANGLGLSEKTVRSYVKVLKQHRLIEVKRQAHHDGEYGEFTGYEMNQYSINKQFSPFGFYNMNLKEASKKINTPPVTMRRKLPLEVISFLDFGDLDLE